MAQIFQISDGTTTIDLLSPTGNYHLAKWESGISQWKDGGIFSENPLVDGRVPIDRAFDSVQEKITIHITGNSQDNVIASLRSLLTLLDASYTYFVENTAVPSYLIVKSDTETNTRYAVIVSYKIENLPGQFDGPFLVGGKQFAGNLSYSAIYVELELVIERDHWLNAAPGSSVGISIQNQYSYNSVTYGQSSTSSDFVYIAPHRTEGNLTHIYRYDSSATSWSGNIFNTSLPYNLLASSTGVGDETYFGIQNSLTDSGTFHNIVFRVGTASSGVTGVWEIYAGSWLTLKGADYTQSTPVTGDLTGVTSFTKTGLGEINFIDESNAWAAGALSSILISHGSPPSTSCYWVRYRVTSVSSPTTPTQSTLQPFVCTRPYIDINSASIGGDIEALSKISIRGRAGTKKLAPTNYITAGVMLAGIRKYGRGSSFTAYLNAADEQNPSGVTVTTSGSFVTIPNTTTGRAAELTSLAAGASGTVTFTLASSIAKHFIGDFRIFVRTVNSVQNTGITLTIRTGEMDLFTSDMVIAPPLPTVPYTDGLYYTIDYVVTDLGIINIPYTDMISYNQSTDILESLSLVLTFKNVSASANSVDVVDVVLIPSDESIVEVREVLNSAIANNGIYYNRVLEIDNTTLVARSGRALLKDSTSGNIVNIYRLNNSGGLQMPLTRSLLWFFYYDKYIPIISTLPELTTSSPNNNVFGVKLSTANRYLIPRGNT